MKESCTGIENAGFLQFPFSIGSIGEQITFLSFPPTWCLGVFEKMAYEKDRQGKRRRKILSYFMRFSNGLLSSFLMMSHEGVLLIMSNKSLR